jgi:formylglycine-generating enzyme required for sulfatase activity/serine/threonine protein kinase
MPVPIACPQCVATYQVAEETLGRAGRCKQCGAQFSLVADAPLTRHPTESVTDPESSPRSSPSDPSVPRVVGRYEVVRKLGAGGMGAVYLARDTLLDRVVALKVPHPSGSPESRARFLREARAAAKFHHPNFCRILDIGEVDGAPFLVMDFVDGQPLRDRFKAGQPWEPREAARVILELALALAEAHREGIIHRDLKPGNVMVDGRGKLVIMDFGLARWHDVETSLTPTGAVLGTPAYMPPEQARGDQKAIGPHSDVYSLGVIFYEMLAGRRPFEGGVYQILIQVASTEPEPPSAHNPASDPDLTAVCIRMLAKSPVDRMPSMEELAGRLQTWLDRPTVVPIPPPRPVPVVPARVLLESSVEALPVKVPSVAVVEKSGSVHWIIAVLATFLATVFGIVWILGPGTGIPPAEKRPEKPAPRVVTKTNQGLIADPKLEPQIAKKSAEEPIPTEKSPDISPPSEKAVTTADVDQAIESVRGMLKKVVERAADKAIEPSRDLSKQAGQEAATKLPDLSNPRVQPLPSITNSIGMKMNLIPAGEFLMGAPDGEPDSDADEKPQHRVRISRPFYLGIYEVTQAEYEKVMGINPSRFSASGPERDRVAGKDTSRFPVEWVSWDDAVNFCNKLSEIEKLRPCYYSDRELAFDGKGYRLPTEAEWEYACRAGTTTAFAFGPELTPKDARFAFASEFESYSPVPVGKYRPNGFGIYDMHGNVWEWCFDGYDPQYYATLPALATDPVRHAVASGRIIRGGAWGYNRPSSVRSAKRGRETFALRSKYLGFRVARVQSGQPGQNK